MAACGLEWLGEERRHGPKKAARLNIASVPCQDDRVRREPV
jgi:hypothetical protein